MKMHSNELEVLNLPENLGIRNIAVSYEAVLDIFQRDKSVVISIPDDAVADISFVQMIESARIYSASLGLSISLSKNCGSSVLSVLKRAGFTDKFSEVDKKFWFPNEVLQ